MAASWCTRRQGTCVPRSHARARSDRNPEEPTAALRVPADLGNARVKVAQCREVPVHPTLACILCSVDRFKVGERPGEGTSLLRSKERVLIALLAGLER